MGFVLGLHQVVRQLLKRDDVNLVMSDSDGRTAVPRAADRGHRLALRILLERKTHTQTNQTTAGSLSRGLLRVGTM